MGEACGLSRHEMRWISSVALHEVRSIFSLIKGYFYSVHTEGLRIERFHLKLICDFGLQIKLTAGQKAQHV